MVSTAFGNATIVEEVRVGQHADGQEFAAHVQLLERDDGELLVRVCYSKSGVARRGPVTFRRSDLRRLARMLAKAPRLAAVIER